MLVMRFGAGRQGCEGSARLFSQGQGRLLCGGGSRNKYKSWNNAGRTTRKGIKITEHFSKDLRSPMKRVREEIGTRSQRCARLNSLTSL